MKTVKTILIVITAVFCSCNQRGGDVMTDRQTEILDSTKIYAKKLSDKMKSIKYANMIENKLAEKISEVGDYYHDFEAFDKYGERLKFSTLTDKYILLDFTSAFCGACRRTIPELKSIDKTYSDSLKIVSFWVLTPPEKWLKSLEQDSITWLSLWDGDRKGNSTQINYGVTAFPTFFLIDPKGIIIDKWLGYSEGLIKEKLKRFSR